VRLRFDDSVEAFRAEFRAWLEANAPSVEERSADPALGSAHLPGWARAWTRRLFDAGWLVPGWPPERGGRNAGPIETLVYLEELARAGVPRTTNPQGLGIVAPSLFDFGNEAQIRDYALPVLRGERSACLGMSEPGAGSDLAALTTRAVPDGDRFVVNGQKVWTSGAAYADFCFLFCRTDPAAPKHKGISVLLVDMGRPGITVRPLPEIVHPDRADLNEVFFDDVVVPASALVGTLNDGWAMANGSLAHERGMVWLRNVQELEEEVDHLVSEAPALLERVAPAERAVLADRVAGAYVDSLAGRALGYRGFAKLVRGGSAPEQALMKAFCSEARRRTSQVGIELSADRGADVSPEGHRLGPDCSWAELYLHSFASTIAAGSSEIQRNIIAERILGLPRG
jgi:alkylation response protein AidB-like acyl-CoA dehydrogenase